MKKIFCDCCGEEMNYDKGPLFGKQQVLPVNLQNKAQQDFEIYFTIRPVKREDVEIPKWANFKQARELKLQGKLINDNSQHFDICQFCRWNMVLRIKPDPTIEVKDEPY